MTSPEDKTVLIVDDEPDVVAYFSGILERAGFNVVTASDGFEALEAVQRRTPDLISLDLVMPRKSGIKFLYELRKNREWSKIPVMIVTAHARDDLGRTDFDELASGRTMSGPLTYLEKPVRPENMLRNVMRVLGLTPPEPEPVAEDPARLRQDIAARVRDLDAETLKRIVKTLDEEENTSSYKE